MSTKRIRDLAEFEFPDEVKNEENVETKPPRRHTSNEREIRRKSGLTDRKQLIKDLMILVFFLIVSITAVILINRFFTKETEGAGNTDGLEQDPVETPEDPVETPEAPTDAAMTEEPLTEEVPTENEGVSPGEPQLYAYQALEPGLSIPVQSGIRMPAWITQDLLRQGADSRPGTAIGPIRHIVIHYVGNVGSSAKQNRDYFEANVDGRRVSSHFIVGMYGEIIQCVPLNEVAYAQGIRQSLVSQGMTNHNYDSISIENCHPYANGQFTSETYWALVKLTAWLLEKYGLQTDALLRHYDATSNLRAGVHGKACPLFFVEHPDAWEQFKTAVGQYMIEHPDIE